MQEREEHREAEEDDEVAGPERLPGESLVTGVHERVDGEREDEQAQQDVHEHRQGRRAARDLRASPSGAP